MYTLTSSDKSRYLSLQIYALNDELTKEGKEMMKGLVENSEIQDVVIANFVDNFQFILKEMEFIEEIARKFELRIIDLPKELRALKTEDEICEHYIDVFKFNWNEKRYLTKDEINEKRVKHNTIAMEIINRMKKEGKL
jgi:hypothetical protein